MKAFLCVTGPPSIAGEGPPSRITKPTMCCYFLNSQSGRALKEWGLGIGNRIEGTGQGQHPCIEFTFRGTLDSSVLRTMSFLSYAVTSVKLQLNFFLVNMMVSFSRKLLLGLKLRSALPYPHVVNELDP